MTEYCCEHKLDGRSTVQRKRFIATGYLINDLEEPNRKFYFCNHHMIDGLSLVAKHLFHNDELIRKFNFKFFDINNKQLELPKHNCNNFCSMRYNK